MKSFVSFLTTVVLSSVAYVSAQSQSASVGCPTGYGFVYPNATNPDQQNLQFQLGQKINIQWRSPWSEVKLAFIGEDSEEYIFIDQAESRPSFGWNVNVNNSKNDNNFYYLYIEDQTDNTQHCYSSLWSITDDTAVANGASQSINTQNPTPTTTRIPTATQQVVAVTSSGPSGMAVVYTTQALDSSAASSTATPPNATPVSNGLSSGAKVGLGVGITVGLLLLVGAAVAAFLLGRRQRKSKEISQAPTDFASPPMNSAYQPMGTSAAAWSPSASTIPSYYHTGPKGGPPHFEGAPPMPYGQPHELDPGLMKFGAGKIPASRQFHEMSATNEPTSHQVYELDGGR